MIHVLLGTNDDGKQRETNKTNFYVDLTSGLSALERKRSASIE